MRKSLVMVGALALAVTVSTGCVSKKVFRKNVAETDTRMQSVETGVETNERRITDLGKDTDSKIASVRGTAEKAVEIGNTAMGKAEDAQKLARGKILWTTTLSDDRVRFSFDQNKLPGDATAMLDDLANRVKSLDKTVYLEIEGHTDNIGSDEYNKMLGEKRAEAVRDYLLSSGLPLHAMNIVSLGETQPVADNTTSDGRAKNRRVVIRVLE